VRRWGFTPFGQTIVVAVGSLALCIVLSGTVAWRPRAAIALSLCLGFLWGHYVARKEALEVVEEVRKSVQRSNGIYTEEDAAREREAVSKMDLGE